MHKSFFKTLHDPKTELQFVFSFQSAPWSHFAPPNVRGTFLFTLAILKSSTYHINPEVSDLILVELFVKTESELSKIWYSKGQVND